MEHRPSEAAEPRRQSLTAAGLSEARFGRARRLHEILLRVWLAMFGTLLVWTAMLGRAIPMEVLVLAGALLVGFGALQVWYAPELALWEWQRRLVWHDRHRLLRWFFGVSQNPQPAWRMRLVGAVTLAFGMALALSGLGELLTESAD
jgi:hypothetical protein